MDMQVDEAGAGHQVVLNLCADGASPEAVQSTTHTSRDAISIHAIVAPVKPTIETRAIASFRKLSMSVSVVAIMFLYVRNLFWSSNIAVTVNQR